jgi:TP901 family phage tail tape measure protein
MAAKNKYQIIVDFLVDLTLEKGKVNEIARKVQSELEKAGEMDIDIDPNKIKKAISQITGQFENVDEAVKQIEKHIDQIDFDKADASLQELENELKSIGNLDVLEQALGDIPEEKFQKLKNDLGEIFKGADPSKVITDVNKLAAQFDKTDRELRQMLDTNKKALAQMKLNGQEGTEAYNKLEKEIAEAEKNLSKLNAAASKTPSAEKVTRGIGERLAVFGLAVQGVDQMTAALNRFTQPMVELDKQMRNVGTLGVKNFQELGAEVSNLSTKLPFQAGEIGNALYQGISAGTIKVKDGIVDTAEAMKFIETAGQVAVAGLSDTTSAVNGLTSVLNAYGMSTEEVDKVADTFFAGIKLGKTSFEEMNAGLAQFVPTAAALDVGFDEATAAIASMTAQGTPTAQATTQINAALLSVLRGSADMVKGLKASGMSLEELKEKLKLPVEQGGGMINVLRDIKVASEKSGVALIKMTGTAEGLKIIETLAGTQEKYNASLQQFQNVQNEIDFGAAAKAYEVAAEGIGVSSNIMMNKVQHTFNQLMDTMGGVGKSALAMTTEFAPLLSQLAMIGYVLPVGKIAEFSKSIMTKLVPALFTQVAAQQGATAAQWKFNAAALANPYILLAAGIAGLIGGLYLLSNALHKTAKEKLEDAKATEESLKNQVDLVHKQKDLAKSSINLVDQFKKEGDAAMENEGLMRNLIKAYPGVIDMSKSYAENLKELEKASGKTKDSLKDFDEQLSQLQDQQIAIDLEIKKINVDVAGENLQKELYSFWGDLGENLKNQVFDIGTLGTGRLFGLNDLVEIDTTKDVRILSKEFQKTIKNLKSDDELLKAGLDFQTEIFNPDNEAFAKLDAKEKIAVQNHVQQIVEAQREVIEAENKKGSKKLIESYNVLYKGGSTEEEIVAKLAKAFNKSEKEIKEMIEAQKDSIEKSKEQKEGVDSLAEAWNEATSKAKEKLNEQLSELAELLKRGKGRTDEEEKRLKILIEEGRANAKDIENYGKIYDESKKLLGLEEKKAKASRSSGKTALQLAKERADLDNETLNILYEKDKIIQDQTLLDEDRTATNYEQYYLEERKLRLLKEQKDNILKQLESMNLIAKTDSGIEINANLKQADKNEINNWLLDAENKIIEQKRTIGGFTVEIDSEELEKSLRELKLKQLEFDIEYGFAEPEEMIAELEKELDELYKAIQIAQIGNEDELATELQSKVIDLQRDINKRKEDLIQEHLEEIQNKYDKHNEELLKKQEEEFKELERLNAVYFGTVSKLFDDKLDNELNRIDKIEGEKLKKYEEWKELGIITEAQYEQKKNDIAEEAELSRKAAEEKADEERMKREAEQAGMRFELERINELQNLEQKRSQLQEEVNIYKNSTVPLTEAQKNKSAELENNLTQTESQIEIKGNKIAALAAELGAEGSEALVAAIAGDPNALKKSAKQYLSFLKGYLEKQLSAYVLGLVLTDSTKTYLAALPFPLNIAAIPLIKATITAAVNKIAGPILNSLTSFSTGGKIESPTVAMIGDASKSGSPRNTEWVMRDSDMMAYAMMAASISTGSVINELRRIGSTLDNQNLSVDFDMDRLRIMLRRSEYRNNLLKR